MLHIARELIFKSCSYIFKIIEQRSRFIQHNPADNLLGAVFALRQPFAGEILNRFLYRVIFRRYISALGQYPVYFIACYIGQILHFYLAVLLRGE